MKGKAFFNYMYDVTKLTSVLSSPGFDYQYDLNRESLELLAGVTMVFSVEYWPASMDCIPPSPQLTIII